MRKFFGLAIFTSLSFVFSVSANAGTNFGPSASLSLNGVMATTSGPAVNANLYLGEAADYVWDSSNAVSAASYFTVNRGDNCGHVPGQRYPWTARTLNGLNRAFANACQLGVTYSLNYVVTDALGHQATATINETIAPTTCTYSRGWTTNYEFAYPGGPGSRAQAMATAVDYRNNVFVAGYGQDANYHYLTLKKNGTTWAPVDNVTDTYGPAVAYGVTTDPLGNVFTAGAIMGSEYRQHFVVRKSPDSGSTWSTVDDFVLQGGHSTMANGITTDSNGNIYAAGWGENDNGMFSIIRKSADHGLTWQTVDLYQYPGGTGYTAARGIRADGAGNIYMVGFGFDAMEVGHYIVRKSADQGATWSIVDDLPGIYNYTSSATGFGFDFMGNLFSVGYLQVEGAYHFVVRRSTTHGSNWSTVDEYTGSSTSLASAIGVDYKGNLYAVGGAQAQRGGSTLLVRKSADNGTTWSTDDDFASGRTAAGLGITTDVTGNVYTVGYQISDRLTMLIRILSCN